MNKEIKKSIIKMYEPLKEQDLVYYDELQKIIDYIWELEHRIEKAIEYIENCNYETKEYKGYVIATFGTKELLEILKGGNNE